MSFLLFAIISATLNFLIRPVQSLSTDPSVVGNRSDTSTTNLSATGDVLCSYRYYGSDLDYESYFNAWSKIPRPLSQNSYGTRGQRVDFHIPIRYQSNDGHCVIDIRPTLRGVAVRGDIARGIDISDAAMRVLDSCVTATIGGSVDGFSMRVFLSA